MKFISIIMISLLLVAISLVTSNEIGKDEQPLNRLARAANGGKGKCWLYLLVYFHICIIIIIINVILILIESNCHYEKSQWSSCDEKTNVKTRTLTLKKGDESCEKIKKIEKKCKKGTEIIYIHLYKHIHTYFKHKHNLLYITHAFIIRFSFQLGQTCIAHMLLYCDGGKTDHLILLKTHLERPTEATVVLHLVGDKRSSSCLQITSTYT